MYNGYNFNYQMPTYQQQYGQLNQLQQPQPIQPSFLNGKIVDSIEMVRAMDVPIGGYGIYPKADLSEIYIKSWNSNGTTNIVTYKIVEQPVNQGDNSFEEKILSRMDALESKIDNIIAAPVMAAPIQNIQPQPQPQLTKQKEEININDAF